MTRPDHSGGSASLPPVAASATGSLSSPKFPYGTIVEIRRCDPLGFVTDTKEDPERPGELLYLVRTWRSASELREVPR